MTARSHTFLLLQHLLFPYTVYRIPDMYNYMDEILGLKTVAFLNDFL